MGAMERPGLETGEDGAEAKALEGSSGEEKVWLRESGFVSLPYMDTERLFLEGTWRGVLKVFSHHLGRKQSLSKTSFSLWPSSCPPQHQGPQLYLAHSGLHLMPVGGSGSPHGPSSCLWGCVAQLSP